MNYEEGSEASVDDGDGRNELGMTEAIGGRLPLGRRDLAFESLYEYGSRVGVWRDALEELAHGAVHVRRSCRQAVMRRNAQSVMEMALPTAVMKGRPFGFHAAA